jgi:hypothetical protein
VRRAIFGAAIALGIAASPGVARAKPLDPTTADAIVAKARADGANAFCRAPHKPLASRAHALCPLAREVKECDELAAACEEVREPPAWNFGELGQLFSKIANVLVWGLVAGVVGIILWFIATAIARAQRDKQASDESAPRPARAVPDPAAEALENATDAQLLLRQAQEHARRGELDRAAALYLAASLRALDDRGAIRIARHRTNGEYVRSCREAETRPDLRAIAREVDRAHFGGEHVTPEGIANVASRASTIVTHTAATLLAMATLVLLGACSGDYKPQLGALDPQGDDLFVALLEKQGVNVAHLDASLVSLPMPLPRQLAPLVVVDASRVVLEDETRAHLERWVESGGVLLLAGDVSAWPEGFKVKEGSTSSTAINVLVEPTDVSDDDDANESVEEKYQTYPAKVATPASLSWPASSTLAATDTHDVYAAARGFKKGLVIGFAGDDLFTNVGLARAPNAAALVSILQTYATGRKIRIASPEDGISPPGSPIASLLHAGLGLWLAHAAAAAIVLMLAFGVRQSRAKLTPPPARRAWTEHIEATGGLYARAKLAPHALWAYARFVDGRLRERMPRGMTDPAAFLALRANADPAWTADVWRRASAARPADRPEGDELLTLRHLSALYAAAVKSE